MAIMQIPPLTPEELVSAEKIKEYFETSAKTFDGRDYRLDNALDHGSNALGLTRRAIIDLSAGKSVDVSDENCHYAYAIALLSPEKRSFEGIEVAFEAQKIWQEVRQDLYKYAIENSNIAIAISKNRAHRLMDAAFRCFDANPENLEAKHYRDLLQQAAGILELPLLGEEKKLSALSSAATKSVAPSKNTP